MLLPVLLQGEPQSGVIWYQIFRQSPKGIAAASAFRRWLGQFPTGIEKVQKLTMKWARMLAT
jgi:hypothetical protein